MEGGGWERPLEEKVDLEQHESGEQAVIQAHHFKIISGYICRLKIESYAKVTPCFPDPIPGVI